ncbi:MAG: DUF4097 family beta strand repeat-containing protein [Geodermatophilaceae bacterium]
MTSMPSSAGHVNALTHTFATPNPLDVSVRNQAGTVEMTAADVAETTVEIIPNDAKGAELAERTRVQLSEDGGRLRVDVPDRKMLRQTALEIIVTMPSGSSVDVQTATADVQTRGVLDGATVATASADVSLSHVRGRLEVATASGDIHVGRGEGPVQIRSASGDVRLDVSRTEASVQTASGDVIIGELSGDLTARSASGDVIVGSASAGSVHAKTMSGDVIVGVAPGLLLWLEVSSLSGDVASELGAEDTVAGPGERGDDGPDLRISASTMSGDVLLRRGR